MVALAATERWYPRDEGSWFLKSGFAAVGFRADGEGGALTALDPGGLFGVALDRRLDRTTMLVPFAQVLVAPACSEAPPALEPPGDRTDYRQALRESWQISQRLRRPDGRTLATVNPYVFRPSRFFDPGLSNGVGQPSIGRDRF